MPSYYNFLSWVRGGVLSHIQTPDLEAKKPDLASLEADLPKLKRYGKLSIELDLTTEFHSSQNELETIDGINLYLYGPADVIGIDRRQIIRTEPEANSQNFLTNYLVAIEFERPDFPWLFTPAKAEPDNQRLRPWICLIVVRQQGGVSLSSRSGVPLPVLTIDSPEIANQELPDLAESWAWAHSQVINQTSSLKDTLNEKPDLNLSRLLCPRHLEEDTHYYACLVPTFEAGRKVGLNIPQTNSEENIDDQTLEPAWDTPGTIDFADAEVFELPVYYHWEFKTGRAGDFKDLARKLNYKTYRHLGSRKLYVGQGGVPKFADMGMVDLEGVFRPVKEAASTTEAVEQEWINSLKEELQQITETQSGAQPTVGPPVYARFQLGLAEFPDTETSWLTDVNLNVRHRVAAGLGVFLVQKLQEELMHSAWQQLGNIQQAQQLKRQRELAKEVSQEIYQKHFVPLVNNLTNPENPSQTAELTDLFFYQFTAPSHARISLQATIASPQQVQAQATEITTPTYEGWSKKNQLPSAGTTSTYRKLSRPKGPIAKRMQAQASVTDPIGVKSAQIGKIMPQSLETALKPLGKVRLDLVGQKKRWQAETPGSGGFDAAAFSRMEGALEKLNDQLLALNPQPAEDGTSVIPLNRTFNNHISQLKNSLNPSGTGQSNSSGSFAQTASVQSEGESEETPPSYEPIPHPTFPQAMYQLMREFAADFLLPGADRIEDNTATILDINNEFIEAFMLGLNHEMSRELLWRNYPTDQRGTYFQNFWSQDIIDLKKIHLWSLNKPLGQTLQEGWEAQSGGSGTDQLALIIRGELLRRFPNAIVYAIKAANETTLTSTRKYPIHRGELANGTIFFLFNLDEAEARGNPQRLNEAPGWFFMIQQQPTEARFGLNTGNDSDQADGLSWNETGTAAGDYLSAIALQPPPSGNEGESTPAFNSAYTANILLRKPYRVGIHASKLLPT